MTLTAAGRTPGPGPSRTDETPSKQKLPPPRDSRAYLSLAPSSTAPAATAAAASSSSAARLLVLLGAGHLSHPPFHLLQPLQDGHPELVI